jgi:hypothetical protein
VIDYYGGDGAGRWWPPGSDTEAGWCPQRAGKTRSPVGPASRVGAAGNGGSPLCIRNKKGLAILSKNVLELYLIKTKTVSLKYWNRGEKMGTARHYIIEKKEVNNELPKPLKILCH